MEAFPTLRHNEVRDLLVTLMSEVCSNVSTEPMLQPLKGEQFQLRTTSTDNAAWLDIKAGGFWSGNPFETTFFDVRVFNPHVDSNRNTTSITSTYRRHEQAKRRQYEQRVLEVEFSSFTPLVFSCTRSAGPSASIAIKQLASKLATKRDLPYSTIAGWLRCRISFALL